MGSINNIGTEKISEIWYGYVTYTDQYEKVDIWGKEQVRNVFLKSGYVTNMGKYFFENASTGTETTSEKVRNVENSLTYKDIFFQALVYFIS